MQFSISLWDWYLSSYGSDDVVVVDGHLEVQLLLLIGKMKKLILDEDRRNPSRT